MARLSIRWLLGELPKLEAEGGIEELYVDDVPIHQWLAENAQKR